MNKKKLAVLVSGSGSNLGALIQAVNGGVIKNAGISLVISSRQDAYALIRAEKAGIPALCIRQDEHILEKLGKFEIDAVLLAGYMKIVTAPILEAYKDRILNIHPSLLPEFGGKGMYGMRVHEEVIKAGAPVSGCTVHIVTENVDAGPILGQATVPVLPGDTPDSLAVRVLKEEHILYPRIVGEFVDSFLLNNDQTLSSWKSRL